MTGLVGGRARGFTLVELVVAIVIIGIALAGILGVMTLTTRHSADPAILRQAVAIAEAYLEEILLRAYDEDAVPGTTGTEGGWGPETGESIRAQYDDVNDYDELNEAPRDQDGTDIGLNNYTVAVDVTNPDLNGVSAARIAVTVQHPAGVNFTLTGYRFNW